MTRLRATLGLVTVAAAMFLVSGSAAAQDASITVEPNADLADGDTLTVSVTGFPASDETFVSGQCVTPVEDPLQQCDVANIVPVPLDENGEATFEITVKVGPIGTGTCGPDGDDCVVLVGSLNTPEINAAAPITFAGGEAEEPEAEEPEAEEPEAEVEVEAAEESGGDGTPEPTAVNSGDGLTSSNGSAAMFAAAAGLLILGGGALALRRRSIGS